MTWMQVMFKGIGNFFGGLFSKKFWHFSLTAVFILIYAFEGISLSVEQRSFEPFYDTVIKRVINADQDIYDNMETIKAEGGIVIEEEASRWQKLKTMFGTYFGLIFGLWFIFWFGYLIYQGVVRHNTSAVWLSIGITIFMVGLIIFLGNVIVAGSEGELTGQSVDDIAFRLLPFKGIVNLVGGLPDLVHPVYEVVDSPAVQSVDVIL